jgi:hypothetical protein
MAARRTVERWREIIPPPFVRAASHVALALLAASTAVVSCWYAARSFSLAIELINPWAYNDLWTFIHDDYFRYVDGRYRWINLFDAHNEHRIATSRVVLFADAIFFQMRGALPVLVMYGAMAALGVGMTASAAPRRQLAVAPFFIMLGLLWATVQWDNFGSAFQMPMVLIHLFAFLVLLAAVRTGASWLALYFVADFLAVFTLGSGIFLIIPIVLAALWTRRPLRQFALLAGAHLALTAVYLNGVPMATTLYGFSLSRFATLVLGFIGLLVGPENAAVGIMLGVIGLLSFLGLAAALTIKAKYQPADYAAVTLVALAGFVVIEGCVVAYTRFGADITWRYATHAVVFWACILAASWRMLGHWFVVPLLVATVALTAIANQPTYESVWRYHTKMMSDIGAQIAAGDLSPTTLTRIVPNPPDYLADTIRRLKALKVGPFASIR